MDTLRSCYTTEMFFPGFGKHWIRWYWTDQPPLDKNHVYGSHNHIREQGDDDADTGEPGEVWGSPRKWYSGSPPVQCFCDGPMGTDEAWVGETDSGSPLFPSCIWGPEFDSSMSEEFLSQYYYDNTFVPFS